MGSKKTRRGRLHSSGRGELPGGQAKGERPAPKGDEDGTRGRAWRPVLLAMALVLVTTALSAAWLATGGSSPFLLESPGGGDTHGPRGRPFLLAQQQQQHLAGPAGLGPCSRAGAAAPSGPPCPGGEPSPAPDAHTSQPAGRAEATAPGQGAPAAPSPVPPSLSVEGRAQQLVEAWSQAYGLQAALPPAAVAWKDPASRGARWAPHLEECHALGEMRGRAEGLRSASSTNSSAPPGELRNPAWACAEGKGAALCPMPRVPWVPGGERDSLPLTHEVQRDLWLNQFPAHRCQDPGTRFLVAEWAPLLGHGMGSQMTLMAIALGVAVHSKRVLVMPPFERANHTGCASFGRASSYECYFFPMTWPECQDRALSLVKSLGIPERNERERALNPRLDIVRLSHFAFMKHLDSYGADLYWERVRPQFQGAPMELLGSVTPPWNDTLAKITWWRSQTFRFMMRWPSAYLCHLVNRARHQAYGHTVAREVAESEAEQGALELGRLGRLDPSEHQALHSNDGRGTAAEETPEWRFQAEPYIPRPIISMHVRQGDKGTEMKLFGFESYMWLANRAKRMVPGLRHIWLSTEMEAVVNATAEYKAWVFLHTDVPRQSGSTSMFEFEQAGGLEKRVGDSWVNLIIASTCDMFVGVLGSNWNRMIDGLRLTGGRLKSTYMALNHDLF